MFHDMEQIAEPSLKQTLTRKLIARLRGLIPDEVTDETPEDAAARRNLERTRAGVEIKRLRASRDTELPALAAVEEQARARLEAIRPDYEQARDAFEQARATYGRRSSDFDFALDMQVRRVAAAADPIIEEVRQALIDLMDEARATPILTEERNELYDQRTTAWVHQIWGNAPSIEARLAAILLLFRDLDNLKAEPVQDGIRERLAALVEALPDAGAMVMMRDYPSATGERPWPTYRQAREELIGRPIDDGEPERHRSRSGRLRQLFRRNG